jgi:hypothetical protein
VTKSQHEVPIGSDMVCDEDVVHRTTLHVLYIMVVAPYFLRLCRALLLNECLPAPWRFARFFCCFDTVGFSSRCDLAPPAYTLDGCIIIPVADSSAVKIP